jgi:hypothetical protein
MKTIFISLLALAISIGSYASSSNQISFTSGCATDNISVSTNHTSGFELASFYGSVKSFFA